MLKRKTNKTDKTNIVKVLTGKDAIQRGVLQNKTKPATKTMTIVKIASVTDVVQVYSPTSLDDLITSSKSVLSHRAPIGKRKSIKKRRLMNVLLGITPTDLICIAQQ